MTPLAQRLVALVLPRAAGGVGLERGCTQFLRHEVRCIIEHPLSREVISGSIHLWLRYSRMRTNWSIGARVPSGLSTLFITRRVISIVTSR